MMPHADFEDNIKGIDSLSLAALRKQLVFYDTKAEEICLMIMEEIKKQGGRTDLMTVMYKHMTEARKMAIDTASKLAPYENPRLESIEVNKRTVTKFVIEAPSAIKNTDEWLDNAKKELNLLEKARREASTIEHEDN